MDDAPVIIVSLLFLALVVAAIVLPIVALAISISTKRKVAGQLSALAQQPPQIPSGLGETRVPSADAIRQLEARIAKLEAASGVQTAPSQLIPPPQPAEPVQPAKPEVVASGLRVSTTFAPPSPPIFSTSSPSSAQTLRANANEIESVIGRRWIGWAAIVIILFATAFFLKYAFDNRWIGELGRVALGIIAGVALTLLGFRYYRKQWRIFSQILTAGGVVLLYLSIYAAFGYYHLASQKTAFTYLAILIAESAALAILYDAPAIAVMALIGGFLNPLLLYTERDQYRSLFAYIAALDVGTVAVFKRWPGLSSLAFSGTHLLFWLWFGEHYHPAKLGAVMIFQSAVFAMFLLAVARKRIAGEFSQAEDVVLLLVNPFVFFATSYYLLNPNHHDWMGAFAIGMSLIYAAVARFVFDSSDDTLRSRLISLGIALTFVTMAVPIQFKANWITIAWAVEALVMLWAALEVSSSHLQVGSHLVLGFALLRLVFRDTPFQRQLFTPVVNKYFLSSLVVIACVFGMAYLFRRGGARKQNSSPQFAVVFVVLGLGILWFVMSVETITYFYARAAAFSDIAEITHERWLGQMALSVLWSIYAAVLAAIGFLRGASVLRWVALSLFALTIVKAMLVDIAALQQLYRIVVFFVLGLLLLLVAWGYHKAYRSREASP